MNKEKLDKFLDELSALTDKYKIEIAGCGCCGSPYLEETKIEDGVYTVDCNAGILEYETKTPR